MVKEYVHQCNLTVLGMLAHSTLVITRFHSKGTYRDAFCSGKNQLDF